MNELYKIKKSNPEALGLNELKVHLNFNHNHPGTSYHPLSTDRQAPKTSPLLGVVQKRLGDH